MKETVCSAQTEASSVISSQKVSGEALFSGGPFLESKEYLADFWIIEAPDVDVALKLAAEGSKHCNRKVEVRAFLADPA